MAEHFITQRMVDIWNALPKEMVKSDIIIVVRWDLNRHLKRHGM